MNGRYAVVSGQFMSFQSGQLHRQAIIVVLHYAAGLISLWCAVYFLVSDALPYDELFRFGRNRSKGTICGFFFIAAYMLLSSARQYGHLKQKAIGYSCIALGFATVWLIFVGSSIEV
jgi:hypothetical protein